MTDAERDYWIAEGRIRQISDDLKADLDKTIAAVDAALDAARKTIT